MESAQRVCPLGPLQDDSGVLLLAGPGPASHDPLVSEPLAAQLESIPAGCTGALGSVAPWGRARPLEGAGWGLMGSSCLGCQSTVAKLQVCAPPSAGNAPSLCHGQASHTKMTVPCPHQTTRAKLKMCHLIKTQAPGFTFHVWFCVFVYKHEMPRHCVTTAPGPCRCCELCALRTEGASEAGSSGQSLRIFSK